MIRLCEYQLTSEGRGSVAKAIRRLISIQKLMSGFEFIGFQSNVFKLGLLFKLEMTSGIKVANNLLGPLPEKIVRFRFRSLSNGGRKRRKNMSDPQNCDLQLQVANKD